MTLENNHGYMCFHLGSEAVASRVMNVGLVKGKKKLAGVFYKTYVRKVVVELVWTVHEFI